MKTLACVLTVSAACLLVAQADVVDSNLVIGSNPSSNTLYYYYNGMAVIGAGNTLNSGRDQLVIGSSNNSTDYESLVVGISNDTSLYSSIAVGDDNDAYGSTSLVVGSYNYVDHASNTLVVGMNNYSQGTGYLFGSGLMASGGNNGAIFGNYNLEIYNGLLVVGNGTFNGGTISRRNALEVYQNGDVNIPGGTLNLFANGASTPSIVLNPATPDIKINGKSVLAPNGDGFVGIGTGATAPFTNLHVRGAMTGKPQLLVNSSASAISPAIELKDNAATPNRWWLASGVANGTDGKFVIHDARQGQSRLVIDTAGNIGMGTASPVEKLQVNGSLRLGAGTADEDIDYSIKTAGQLSISANSASPQNSSYVGLSLSAGVGADQSSISIAGSSSDTYRRITFSTLGTERMRISKVGSIGIGTTSPYFGVDVYNGHLVFKNDSSQTDQGNDPKLMGIGWASNNQANVISNLLTVERNGNYGGDFKFYGRSVWGGTMPPALATLTADGKFGVGTTAPQTKLDIRGNVAMGTNLSNVAANQIVIGKYNDSRTNDTTTSPAATNHTDGVFVVAAGDTTTGANSIRVLNNGIVLVKPSGDIPMGNFTNGPTP
jgi:hypothetical protein